MGSLELRFRLLGIPIRVQPSFWLVTALLGFGLGSPRRVLIWVACVFVGVIVHELGHALVARHLGGEPEVVLYGMGGVTKTPPKDSDTWWKSALVSAAGPAVGFLLGSAVMVTSMVLGAWRAPAGAPTTWLSEVTTNLVWINIGWGLINLLPVLPLDGAGILREVLGRNDRAKGTWRALWVSVVVGPVVTLLALKGGLPWAAMLFGLFSANAFRSIAWMRHRRADQASGTLASFEECVRAYEAQDFQMAQSLAERVAQGAKDRSLAHDATQIQAAALLHLGRPSEAAQILLRAHGEPVDPMLLGTCLLAAGQRTEAIRSFEMAMRSGHPEAPNALADALDQAGEHRRAEEIRQTHRNPSDREA